MQPPIDERHGEAPIRAFSAGRTVPRTPRGLQQGRQGPQDRLFAQSPVVYVEREKIDADVAPGASLMP